ncbi:MAG: TonB-dependent receptor plug domain-containing protein [Hyphomonadaceae bacterium]
MRNLFVGASLAASFMASAFAEDAEIVVTATRAPAPAEDLPARIDVIDRTEIEERALASVAEAIGPEAVQSGGAGQQTSLFLRGANSKHALALLDGVRLNDASNPTAQYDFGLDTLGALERIEVLRGPASAVYGSDAIGGVVNLIPRRGGATAFEPFLEAAAGSFGAARGLIGAAGSAGGWDYGISGEHVRSAGHDLTPARMATATGDADAARLSTATAAARYRTGALAFDMLARARDTRVEYDTFSGGPFFDLRADDPDLETEASQRLWRVGGEAGLAPALSFRLSGGEVRTRRTDIDGGLAISSASSVRAFADAALRYEDGALSLTGGVSFTRDRIDTRPQFASPLQVAEDQSAAYAIAQVRLNPATTLTASVRTDDYENFGAHTTYALGAVTRVGPVRVFASYGTAFKAPSLSERYETSLFNIGNPALEPETSRSWEVGADWRLGPAFRLGASYYETRIENLIEYDFAALQNLNIGAADISGAEAFAEADAGDWATLRIAYAWTDAQNAVTGAALARRPENTWRLDARIRPNDRLTLAATWSYVGARTDVLYSDAGAFLSAAGRTPSFQVASAAASFDLDAAAQVFVRIDNLTDEVYEQPAAFAGPPRSIMFGVRADF